jgi:hypothetical protein
MAEETEVIIRIAVDQEEAADKLVQVKQALTNLTEEKQKQTEAYKKGNITEREYAEELVRIEGNQKKLGEEYRRLTEVQNTNSNSINALRQNNKDLLKERNNLDTSTQAGKERLKQLNEQLDKNNAAIKANVSGYEKQKIGIGGYADAIGQFFPALGSATKGVQGLDKGLWKLVANPIGAIITAIVGVVALLYKGLSQTAGGADLLEDSMAQLSAIFDVVMDRVGKVAGALIEFFKGNFTESANMMKESVSGIGDELANATKEAKELARATRDLEDAEIAFAVAGAKTENQIKRLILESKNRSLSESERMKKLAEATKLEEERVKEEIKNADEALRIASAKAAQRLNIVKKSSETEIEFGERVLEAFTGQYAVQADDLRDKVQEMLIARENAEGKSLSFLEKIQNQRDALEDKATEQKNKRLEKEQQDREKAYDEEQKWRERVAQQEAKKTQEEADRIIKQNKEKQERENTFNKAVTDFRTQIVNKAQDQEEERKKKTAEYEQKVENAKNQALDNAGNLLFAKKQGLRTATNAVFKQDAIKEIVITTRSAAMKAYDAFAKIPLVGPALGVAAAGATIAYGASQVAQIVGIPFARGGRVLSGQRIRSNDGQPIYRSNGDNLLASVRTGEVILNERQQAMLGGDRTFRRIGVPGFATGGMVGNDIPKTTLQLDKVLNAINKQKTILVLEDFERVSNRKYDAEQTAIVV